jgi:hypothetical protein
MKYVVVVEDSTTGSKNVTLIDDPISFHFANKDDKSIKYKIYQLGSEVEIKTTIQPVGKFRG